MKPLLKIVKAAPEEKKKKSHLHTVSILAILRYDPSEKTVC